MSKRYYWLKLHNDFFDSVRIRKLRSIAGGDTFTIIYLKLLLYSIAKDGIIEYQGVENTISEELALALSEDAENVGLTLQYLKSVGLAEIVDDALKLPEAIENVGSETATAQRVRDYRERNNLISTAPKTDPKSHAERQRSYRAKQNCSEVQHIPMIEDYMNRKRYGGNYYLVCQREKYKCAMCGSTENLCVHHIDGYDENKPQNNATNKMVLLCRECHSNVHAGTPIPNEVLNAIGYWSDESDVTCNVEIEKEIDKEKNKKKEDISYEISKKEKPSRFTPPTLEEVQTYITENNFAIDAQKFIDYYQSNGWMVGKAKMKDWKATVRNWQRREQERFSQTQKKKRKDEDPLGFLPF